MPLSEAVDLDTEASQIPEGLALWQCIGCGAMGNSEPCIAKCDYRKLEIVGAEEYAELLDIFFATKAHAEGLKTVVREVAALDDEKNDHERTYLRLQARAREILRSANFALSSEQNIEIPEVEPATVWLCTTCGQVEAPQSCLGVCIRRNGEFLRATDYYAQAKQAEATRRRARELHALVHQLAWVAPHVGQWKSACRAFREKAIKLLTPLLPEADMPKANDLTTT